MTVFKVMYEDRKTGKQTSLKLRAPNGKAALLEFQRRRLWVPVPRGLRVFRRFGNRWLEEEL